MTTPDVSRFRTDPARVADERTMYQGWLDFHRGTLLWKGAGLTDDQWELYDTREDFSLVNDLSGTNPEKLKQMQANYDANCPPKAPK